MSRREPGFCAYPFKLLKAYNGCFGHKLLCNMLFFHLRFINTFFFFSSCVFHCMVWHNYLTQTLLMNVPAISRFSLLGKTLR